MIRHLRFAAALLILPALAVAGCGSDDEPTGPDTEPPAITTDALPTAFVEEPYSASVGVEDGNGEYFWSVVGSLPRGLVGNVDDLTLDEFLITGTPEADGSFFFRVAVEDGLGRADTSEITLVVQPHPVRTLLIPPALTGEPYEVALEAAGATAGVSWSIVEGNLPAGLELSSSGEFSGAPTTPDTATFRVQVETGGATASRELTLPVLANNPDGFDIASFPVVEVPEEFRDNVAEAVRRWEEAISGDLENITLPTGSSGFGPSDCFGFGPMANGSSMDDLMVMVNIDSIDGPFGILGQAGPCGARFYAGGDSLPFIGVLTLDEADLGRFTEETVTDIIQHEIGHILGFGTLWSFGTFGFLEGEGGEDPRYTGEAAIAEYQAAGGTDSTIPVQEVGGEGTRDSHWRESVFDRELLTGFSESDGIDMFLSRMSIASFADLGYQVDLSVADGDALLPPAPFLTHDADGPAMFDIVLDEPILTLENGRIINPASHQ